MKNTFGSDLSLTIFGESHGRAVGVELRGKTLGVVGMGRIGSGVAKRAMAFDMNVLAYDPYINEERAKALGVKVATFDEVIENSDFITVHMPLTKETKGMIAMEQMKKMKPGVRLVNCARGGIIDEADLAEALKQGIVAAAAIDVYTSEPPAEKGNPLLEAPNIVLTPHLGASTVEAQIGVSVDVAKGIIAALHGEPVATAVNMAPVSPQVMRVIAPYLMLAERLGGTVVGLADGPIESVEVTYNGEITEVNTGLLTTAVIKGILNPVMENEVNYVNAPGLAKERGIKVSERKERASEDFANLITVDVVAGGGEPPLQPVQQVLSLLLDELHLLHVLVQGGAQLLHLPVPLVGQLLIQEDQRAVGWEVGQQIDQRRPLSLVQLEDVHVRDGDEGVLRHHGHGLCRLRQLLYRQALTGETVVVELLEARRDQQLLQPLRHGLEQIALLTVENIEISRYACLHGGPQRLIAAAAALLFCHVSPLPSP